MSNVPYIPAIPTPSGAQYRNRMLFVFENSRFDEGMRGTSD
jgi:hypothetical protein